MHASIEQLLEIRAEVARSKGGGSDSRSASSMHVQTCPTCQAEIRRIDALGEELRALPEIAPDPGSEGATWDAISARLNASGAGRAESVSKLAWWPLALAASLLVAALVVAVVVPQAFDQPPKLAGREVPMRTVPENRPVAESTVGPQAADTSQLVARSQQLERLLGSLSYEPRVVSAQTAGTIAQLEDQIAWVDYGLSAGGDGRLSERDSHALWEQRVELMNSLVHVRYAQAQRVDF